MFVVFLGEKLDPLKVKINVQDFSELPKNLNTAYQKGGGVSPS